MYLIDTNIVSEMRKGSRADRGVREFMETIRTKGEAAFLSVVTFGEIRCGIDSLRQRGDALQADRLESWYRDELAPLHEEALPVDIEVALVWGALRARAAHHEFDKLIAATALLYDLTVVTRNERDFAATGARVMNPFS